MRVYRFFDTDVTGAEEYDISGEQYQKLLQTCFQYSATVSVILSPWYVNQIEAWEPYRIPITPTVQEVYGHYGVPSELAPDRINGYEIRHYRLALPMQELILAQTDSIFKWRSWFGCNHPDDLTFYRADGSVFFTSTTHEGECTLFLREDEPCNVAELGDWLPTDDGCFLKW